MLKYYHERDFQAHGHLYGEKTSMTLTDTGTYDDDLSRSWFLVDQDHLPDHLLLKKGVSRGHAHHAGAYDTDCTSLNHGIFLLVFSL